MVPLGALVRVEVGADEGREVVLCPRAERVNADLAGLKEAGNL